MAACFGMDLRFGLHYRIDQVQLSLGNLDDLLNKTSANLVLELLNPVGISVSRNQEDGSLAPAVG